ncbi:hypothetical protein GCM10010168_49840 [Actinoplanes ianthinogenes]|uniref:Uncharacterized protein n=1 Tax=Actinoplanes ianthinogenes TaxID=122358 RepID=A0ABN6CM09_9ACTN|nr:hypothetical protein [Actinoplanes ianthinogenes]BCJ46036.1 hypothetical protein Aiant_66930 [Actinoplanes ianthinogenes]GGR25808.1 hypothetical protein GCM10010168_49840 [Actinoplanes ianthinogenes]
MTLVEELIKDAALSDAPLDGLCSGKDRFGSVDALLPTVDGHVSVRSGCDTGYELAIWVRDEIVAEGRTRIVAELLSAMIDIRKGVSVGELCLRHGYLRVTDSETANDALWHLLTEHGENHLRAEAAAICANPVLRQLRPWVSHGTLHLIHSRDRVESVRYGLVFYPTADNMFQLNVYNESPGPAEPLGSAIARAAAVVEGWH